MSHITGLLLTYGYWALFVIIIARQACLPVPANLALVVAGAMARSGTLNPIGVIGVSVGAFLCADFAWFEMGRTLGPRTLRLICSLSHDSHFCEESIIAKLDLMGWRTLVIAKFIIGLDSIAAPMAGVKGLTRSHFLLFDSIGATLWSGTYFAAGLLFSKQLADTARHFPHIALFAALAILIVFLLLIARRLSRWHRLRV